MVVVQVVATAAAAVAWEVAQVEAVVVAARGIDRNVCRRWRWRTAPEAFSF